MIERYRETAFSRWLEASVGDWAGVVLIAAAGLLIGAIWLFLHRSLTTLAKAPQPTDTRTSHD